MNDQQPTVTPGAPEPEPWAPGPIAEAVSVLALVSRIGHDVRAVKFEPINPLDAQGRRTAAGAPLWRVTVQRKSGSPLNVIRSTLTAVCVAALEELGDGASP
jgi:hypothetical protein